MPDSPAAKNTAPREGVSVLAADHVPRPYDYLVPAGLKLKRGDVVRVPLGPRELVGIVWARASGDVTSGKLRMLREHIDVPALPVSLLDFIDWVADYTLNRPGAVLSLSLKSAFVESRDKPHLVYRLAPHFAGRSPIRLTAQRRRVLALAADGRARTLKSLTEESGVSEAVMRGLINEKVLEPALAVPRRPALPDGHFPGPVLSSTQAKLAATLKAAVKAQQFICFLLDGVPGAGKTETYCEAIAQALRNGRQALLLMPEIALTMQFIARLEARFNAKPLVWHSAMTIAARRHAFRQVLSGEAPLVIGARSALFLPFPKLGVLIVDEEHDPAYKQEEGVIYHARDMAVVRGRICRIPVILSSATPSLESYVNAEQGRYRRLTLPERHGSAVMPELESVDLRQYAPPRSRFLSPLLTAAIAENLEKGEQTLLFLNRRGYAPLTLCRRCGHRFNCPNCSAWLVDHRGDGNRRQSDLQCHHCGHQVKRPLECPSCGTPDSLVACGPGVERIAEEIGALFPNARRALMSSDNMSDVQATQNLYQAMAERRIDIIIGTQLAAKGHHFPHLTLVGVVDADLGLSGGDPRAAERSFQLLFQVAGRAGRASNRGRVMIQTYMPDHPVMAALISKDRDAFMKAEVAERRRAGLPPFGRLVGIVLSGKQQEKVAQAAQHLARAAPGRPEIRILGPAPAPIAVLRGRHRMRLLLKAHRQVRVQDVMRDWLARVKLPSSVRLAVDIDPISFF
jgi:primosomal protein N' (replication factor Y)